MYLVLLRIFSCLLVLSLATSWQLSTAQSQCQRDVERGGSVVYKDRGDRCEGTFRQKVAMSTAISIVGFQYNRPIEDFVANKETGIDIYAAGQEESLLTVVSLRTRDFYQMDTVRQGDDPFDWSMRVIRRLEPTIPASMIAAVACVENCDFKPSSIPRLLPVKFDNPQVAPAPYITLRSARSVKNLTASLMNDQGESVLSNIPIGTGYVARGRPAVIRLDDAPPGWNTLEVRGEGVNGGDVYLSAQIWIAGAP